MCAASFAKYARNIRQLGKLWLRILFFYILLWHILTSKWRFNLPSWSANTFFDQITRNLHLIEHRFTMLSHSFTNIIVVNQTDRHIFLHNIRDNHLFGVTVRLHDNLIEEIYSIRWQTILLDLMFSSYLYDQLTINWLDIVR